jgi:hypothetical protein
VKVVAFLGGSVAAWLQSSLMLAELLSIVVGLVLELVARFRPRHERVRSRSRQPE